MLQRIILILLALALGACASNRYQIKQETAGFFAIYGNWCGPDHPRVMDPPPEALDQLDAACMRHDYCYVQKGYLNCDCDNVLVTELKYDISSGIYDVEQGRYASSFANYFQDSPCTQTRAANALTVIKEGIVNNVYNPAKAGLRKFIDFVGGEKEQTMQVQEENETDSAVGGSGATGTTAQQSLQQDSTVNGKSPITAQPISTEQTTLY